MPDPTRPPPWVELTASLGAGRTVGERVLAWSDEDRTTRTVWVFGPGVYAGVFPRPGARLAYGPEDLLETDLQLAADHLRALDAPAALERERGARRKDGDSRSEILAWEQENARERARPWRDRVVENAVWTSWWTSLFPRVDLDDGQVVWSLQGWWSPLAEAAERFAGFRVVPVPVPRMPAPPPFPREREWRRP